MINDIAIYREFGTEVYYSQTCNCNSLGYYQNAVCPVCGEKMIRMEYIITENKNINVKITNFIIYSPFMETFYHRKL